MTNIIKKIEKHKMELLNGFKKQLLLIDNLKKQKVGTNILHIPTGRHIHIKQKF